MKKIMKAIAAIMLMTVVMFTTGCKKDNAEGDGTVNGHTYVDLGLPSGTLWAACNVGANTPEEYGDFFAWGETQPKTTYNWSTYKYCNNGKADRLTKYCDNPTWGDNGFTDNQTVLQPSDDAATANWGNDWCMPTYAQWVELYDHTAHIFTVQNGAYGLLFSASNGASLFLPAAGYSKDDGLGNVGSQGYYWSSTLDTDYNPLDAWGFYFQSGSYHVDSYGYRYYGRSVRAVRSARQN